MVICLPEADDGGFSLGAVERIEELAIKADAVVAGPGVKPSDLCRRITDALLDSAAAVALDVALLHALEPSRVRKVERSSMPVLLPNADELASLLDCDPKEVAEDPVQSGIRAAELFSSVVLVKGITSHVVTPGGECWTYKGGASGLGGVEIWVVVAGLDGGLLARGADPLSATLWSVWLHGESGAQLAKKIGPVGFLAREIAEELPALMTR